MSTPSCHLTDKGYCARGSPNDSTSCRYVETSGRCRLTAAGKRATKVKRTKGSKRSRSISRRLKQSRIARKPKAQPQSRKPKAQPQSRKPKAKPQSRKPKNLSIQTVDYKVFSTKDHGRDPRTERIIRNEKEFSNETYGAILDRMADMPLRHEITYANGTTVYALRKGTRLYHASPVAIQTFDRMAFFTLHPNISLFILAMKNRLITESGSVSSTPLYLYSFEVQKDTYLVRSKKMGVVVGGHFKEFSPYSEARSSESLKDYCRRHACQGFWSWRDCAPIPPVFQPHRAYGMWKSQFKKFLDLMLIPQVWRDDPIYTMEFVLCNPSLHLKTTGVYKIHNHTLAHNMWKASREAVNRVKSIYSRKDVFEAKAQLILTAPLYARALSKSTIEPYREFEGPDLGPHV